MQQLPEVFCKKRCSWKFRKIHKKTPVPATLLKKGLTQVFSCEFCEISQNNFFTEHLWKTAFGYVFSNSSAHLQSLHTIASVVYDWNIAHTRLRLALSHLYEQKNKHNFLHSVNPICSCGFDIQSTCNYLIHCSNFVN